MEDNVDHAGIKTWLLPYASALLLPLASACAAQPAKIPSTQIELGELLFYDDLPHKLERRGPDEWSICRGSAWVKEAKTTFISSILRDYSFLQIGKPGKCNVRFSFTAKENEPYFYYHGCGWPKAFLSKDGVNDVTIVLEEERPDLLEKCIFRLGLYLIGYQGAPQIEDDRLFVPVGKSPWMTIGGMPSHVPIVQWVLSRCGFEPSSVKNRKELLPKFNCPTAHYDT